MAEPMEIIFGDGDRVDARYRGRTISTDQRGTIPRPFDLFLAALGTCSGLYIARFCKQRGIPTEHIRLLLHTTVNPETRMVERIELELKLPDDFPDKYHRAVVRAAELGTVTQHLNHPPRVDVRLEPTPVA